MFILLDFCAQKPSFVPASKIPGVGTDRNANHTREDGVDGVVNRKQHQTSQHPSVNQKPHSAQLNPSANSNNSVFTYLFRSLFSLMDLIKKMLLDLICSVGKRISDFFDHKELISTPLVGW